MAVKKIGHDQYRDGEGVVHTSLQAAQKADLELTLKARRASDLGEKILEKIPTKDLPALFHTLTIQAEALLGAADHAASAQEFFEATPEFDASGPYGVQNAAALGAYLRSKGYRPPFAPDVLRQGYEDLVECGALHLKGKPKIGGMDEDEIEKLPTQEILKRAHGGFIPGSW